MLGVTNTWPAHPPATKAMIDLIAAKLPSVTAYPDVPKEYPEAFIVVKRVGGEEILGGRSIQPLFAFDCYAHDVGSAETLAEDLLAALKNAQFQKNGSVQFRKFTLVGAPQMYNNPAVPGRRRFQMSATYSIT